MYFNKTPGEVAEDRRGSARDLEDEAPKRDGSVLADRMRQADARGGRDDPGMDLER